MNKNGEIEQNPAGQIPGTTSWSKVLFFASLGGFCVAATGIMLQRKQGWAFLIALLAVGSFCYLEHLEGKHHSGLRTESNKNLRPIAAIGSIILFTFVVCLPTLKTYFLVDDFAFVDAFYHFSAGQFLQLLHMDLGRFVWGDSRQEFRPVYGLFYVAVYRIWGLRHGATTSARFFCMPSSLSWCT